MQEPEAYKTPQRKAVTARKEQEKEQRRIEKQQEKEAKALERAQARANKQREKETNKRYLEANKLITDKKKTITALQLKFRLRSCFIKSSDRVFTTSRIV